jgi:hypothetical protein
MVTSLMVALSPDFMDDADLERDLDRTERVLSRLLSMRPWNRAQASKLEQQIAACREHRERERANLEASREADDGD